MRDLRPKAAGPLPPNSGQSNAPMPMSGMGADRPRVRPERSLVPGCGKVALNGREWVAAAVRPNQAGRLTWGTTARPQCVISDGSAWFSERRLGADTVEKLPLAPVLRL